MVQDTHPADRKSDTDKYYLTVNKGGIYKIVYDNITWEIPKVPNYQQSLPDSRQYTDPVKSGHTSSG